MAYHGTLAGLDQAAAGPRDPTDDLVVRALSAGLQERGLEPPGGTLRLTSDIPLGRGLGSSGAAVVAGLSLAAARAAAPLDRDAALRQALVLEGHPDNAAPSLWGGLVATARTADGAPHAFRLPLATAVGFAYAAPGVRLSTAEARRALPASLPHAVAVAGLGRAASLVHGLATGDRDLLRIGFTDDLHVPFRLPLIPGGSEAVAAGLEAGAWAVTVSGSGSGLLAVCPPSGAAPVAEAMVEVFRGRGPDAVGFPLEPDLAGGHKQ